MHRGILKLFGTHDHHGMMTCHCQGHCCFLFLYKGNVKPLVPYRRYPACVSDTQPQTFEQAIANYMLSWPGTQ